MLTYTPCAPSSILSVLRFLFSTNTAGSQPEQVTELSLSPLTDFTSVHLVENIPNSPWCKEKEKRRKLCLPFPCLRNAVRARKRRKGREAMSQVTKTSHLLVDSKGLHREPGAQRLGHPKFEKRKAERQTKLTGTHKPEYQTVLRASWGAGISCLHKGCRVFHCTRGPTAGRCRHPPVI